MKKFIKIFFGIIFIIFILGIITSFAALTVTSGTTAAQMLTELNKSGGYLTGISDQIRDQNPYLYCIEKPRPLFNNATYTKDSSKTYPDNDSTNGYARAYALASTKYIKSDSSYGIPTKSDEKQWAWYYFEGDVTEKNDLVTIALAYQNYKKNEKEFSLTKSDAETIISGDNVIYGPIIVQYSYSSASSGSKSDEWGGFSYAFFDEAGNNISEKVKLCKLNGSTYNPITSTKDNGYYKVSTSDYNNAKLYLVTTDKELTKIIMKVQNHIVNCTATVYELIGSREVKEAGINMCTSCRSNIVESYDEAVNNKGATLKIGKVYYKYSGSYDITDYKGVTTLKHNQVSLDGSVKETNQLPEYTAYKRYIGSNGQKYEDKASAAATYSCTRSGAEYGTGTAHYCTIWGERILD